MTPDGRHARESCPDSFCPDCGTSIGAATAMHDAHGYVHGFVNDHRCPKTGLVWVHCAGYVRGQGYIECHARASGQTREAALAAIGVAA